jgi:hypothetical protein
MAITETLRDGNGSNLGPFSFDFEWLNSADIKVTVDNVLKTVGTHYTLENLNYTAKNGGEILFTAGNAPAIGVANIRIYRQTSNDDLTSTFYSGSAIRAQDLNNNFTQGLYVAQETTNNAVQDVGNVTLAASYTFNAPPSAPTPTSGSHLTTKSYVDTLVTDTAFISGNLSVGDKGDLTVNSASNWTIDPLAVTTAKIANSNVTYAKIQNVSATNRILGRSSAGAGVVEEIACTAVSRDLLSAVDVSTWLTYLGINYFTSTTAVSKTLVNRERCTVTVDGLTITLPAAPDPGWEISVSIAGSFTNTVINRNSANIMSLAENLTINAPNTTLNLIYVDATRGWRIF